MGNRDKRIVINQNMLGANPDLLCLQETKIQEMNDKVVKEVWGDRPYAWMALPSWGASRGILLIWDVDKVDVLDHKIGAYSVSVRYKLKMESGVLGVSGVYDPNIRSEVDDFL